LASAVEFLVESTTVFSIENGIQVQHELKIGRTNKYYLGFQTGAFFEFDAGSFDTGRTMSAHVATNIFKISIRSF
jgi:hypothetical protein